MNVTIVGGGNIGTQFAVHCAEKGLDVVMYTSDPDIFQTHLNIVDETGTTTHEGNITLATNDPVQAFSKADFIMVTFPANLMNGIAETIYRYAPSSAIIGVVPGNGGSECAFQKCIVRNNPFFLMERVPAIARLVQKGKTVKSTGYRDELHIASMPASVSEICCGLIQSIFDKKCIAIPGILNLTMTPSNPILHTTRLKCIFKDYHTGKTYDKLPLFYEDWNDESSELLLACDDEVQKICKALPEHHLDFVKSLRIHYESKTPQELTRKLSGILAFKGIKTPAVEVNGKFVPDFHSRYFTADFSYGLTIIQQIARFADICTPNIDATMEWYRNLAVEKGEFKYSDYGISDKASFDSFYLGKA